MKLDLPGFILIETPWFAFTLQGMTAERESEVSNRNNRDEVGFAWIYPDRVPILQPPPAMAWRRDPQFGWTSLDLLGHALPRVSKKSDLRSP
jgi:hypothetical protein